MGYRITKLAFDEKQGITALEMQDENGNTISPIISKNKGLSDANEGNFLDLPAIDGNSLVFSEKKTPKKSNEKILLEWCSKQGTECPECQEKIREFYHDWKRRLQEKGWKGKFDVERLWNNQNSKK